MNSVASRLRRFVLVVGALSTLLVVVPPATAGASVLLGEPLPFKTSGTPIGQGVDVDGVGYFLVGTDYEACKGCGDWMSSDLYRTDGTASGTWRIAKLSGAHPMRTRLVASGGRLIALGSSTSSDHRAWISDGTPQGSSEFAGCPTLLAVSSNKIFCRIDTNGRPRYVAVDPVTRASRPALDDAELLSLDPASVALRPDGRLVGVGRGGLVATDGDAAGVVRFRSSKWTENALLRVVGQLGPDSYVRVGDKLWRTDLTEDGTQEVPGAATTRDGETPVSVTRRAAFAIVQRSFEGRGSWGLRVMRPAETRDLPVGELGQPTFNAQLATTPEHAFFVATDEQHGKRLWATDADGEGRVPLTDGRRDVSELQTAGDRAFFREGGEWFVTEGSPATTAPLQSVRGPLTTAGRFFSSAGRTYFAGDDGVTGLELWALDDRSREAYLVADLNQTPEATAMSSVTAASVSFVSTGRTLWRTDGTAAGTHPISAFSGEIDGLLAVRGGVYVRVSREPHRSELWRSDGTTAGTRLLAAEDDAVTDFSNAVPVDGRVSFIGPGDEGSARAIWSSDGTAAGTQAVVNLPGQRGAAADGFFVRVGGRAAYAFATGGWRLWFTDGTVAGTRRSVLLGVGPTAVAAHGSELIVPRRVGDGRRQLWAVGRRGARQLTRRRGGIPAPSAIHAYRDRIAFTSLGTTKAVWSMRADGRGLRRLVRAKAVSSLNSIGGQLMFATGTGESSTFDTLWGSTGLPGTTRRIRRFTPLQGKIAPDPVVIRGRLYVKVGYRDEDGYEFSDALWESDGTARGTRKLALGVTGIVNLAGAPYAITASGPRRVAR